ncbi:hypothetical protein H4R18_000166 [Coemansia javaensis]|uniref:Zinc-ribbon 15 domain-containing protein n=1 Tax=Coemansia javaensis TaxID=2761396 RepID=A0A9W8LM25_9FUNG|nr:hypothetical protein H4R18_000166 [Coemansia javaensis]
MTWFIIPIFFGVRDHIRSVGAELIPCPRCHNMAIQTINRRRWFTLYCIPVVPISRRRELLHCGICRWEGIIVPAARHSHDTSAALLATESPARGASFPSEATPLSMPAPPPPQSLQAAPSFQPVPYPPDSYRAPPDRYQGANTSGYQGANTSSYQGPPPAYSKDLPERD